MITAGYYWDHEEHELLDVSCYDNNLEAFPYISVYSKRAPNFTGSFRPRSLRARSLIRVNACTSLADVQRLYPEFFI